MNEFIPESEQTVKTPSAAPALRYLVLGFLITIILVGVATLVTIWYLNTPPANFDAPTVVTIKEGETAKAITEKLAEQGVVRSQTLLYFMTVLFFDPTDIKASTYVLSEPLSTYEVAERLTRGDFAADLIRFTHIEGEPVKKVADRAAEQLGDFDGEEFMRLASTSEGYLFPDTYFIPATYSEEELFVLMRNHFDDSIAPLESLIAENQYSLEEIIVLASILEREANSIHSLRLVSGILQNRLADGMPLQADASIEYVLDKPLSELTPDDLKIESPYNTYLNRGLPPTPIGNPGQDAIEAVLFPTKSDYYFYLTDEQGEFHYARTYDEHLANIERYLR